MTQPPATQLLATLSTERAELTSFVTLLEREQKMLIENSTDLLLDLSKQKTVAAISLQELTDTRSTTLQNLIPQLTAAAINSWLLKHCPADSTIYAEILALAKHAHQLNRTNGELIQMKLRHNQQALTVLNNAANKANLYGSDGQPSLSPNGGRSLGSG